MVLALLLHSQKTNRNNVSWFFFCRHILTSFKRLEEDKKTKKKGLERMRLKRQLITSSASSMLLG